MTRTCLDCPKILSRGNKCGRCKSCTLEHSRRDPEVQARRLANLRAVQVTPEHKAKISRGKKASEERHAGDPDWQENHRRQGVRLRAQFDATPGAEEKRKAALAEAMKVRAEKLLCWCPAELRKTYQVLRKKYGADGARSRIKQAIAANEAARLAALTPFEYQLERIRAGARLVEKPSFRRAEYDYSLVGNATGML